jgi:hypothetical protein
MSLLSDVGSFLKKALDGLKTFAKVAFTYGNDLVNAIKVFEATPAGKAVDSVLDTIAGAVIPPAYMTAFKAWFPILLKDLGWVQNELNKTDDQIAADFATWFNGMVNPDAKASVAHVIAGNASKFVSDQSGSGLTIQQALTLPQYTYDPTIFDQPVAVAA